MSDVQFFIFRNDSFQQCGSLRLARPAELLEGSARGVYSHFDFGSSAEHHLAHGLFGGRIGHDVVATACALAPPTVDIVIEMAAHEKPLHAVAAPKDSKLLKCWARLSLFSMQRRPACVSAVSRQAD